jgi:glycosyltransferase involved in cell wall biosynthesis
MRVLLIEPYYGGSHRAWADGYARHSAHEVDLLALPARFWKWRMHGGAATLAEGAARLEARPDVVLASDMLNLSAFLGLARETLAGVPVLLYCHENQLTYPLHRGEKRDLTYGMMNWLSMLAADRVAFNSAFHREAWFEELPRLLKHFPDCSHMPLVPEVRARSVVLPVGCDLARLDAAKAAHARGVRTGDVPVILWNQRWEYDKAPEVFLHALDVLAGEGVPFQVILAGSNVRQKATEFEAAREKLGTRVIHYGWADAVSYARLLWQADVVVSTALHEFFGIAVVEAIYCGCLPLLPRRLAYPEVIPQSHHEVCLYDGIEDLLGRLRWALTRVDEARQSVQGLREAAARHDWASVAPRYDAALQDLAHNQAAIAGLRSGHALDGEANPHG